MQFKVISKDLIPRYFICEDENGNSIIAHDNVINSCIEPVKVDKRTIDITDSNIEEWHVKYYIGSRKWLCKCSCGRLCAVTGYNLASGKSTSCGHEKYNDLRNKSFGEWEVIEYAGVKHGMSMWKCKCSCGTTKDVYAARLLNGRSKSCGHNTNNLKDLKDRVFGEWTALEYVGNHYWKCRCSCGNIKDIAGYSLLRGDSKSCGHLAGLTRKETMLDKYGDIVIGKSREKWQIEAIASKENFVDYIQKRGYKPTADELSNELGINTTNIYRTIHKYELEELIIIDYNSSKYEREIVDILTNMTKSIILQRNRTVIQGVELDIYLPEKKLAIEFNGSYWHSEIYKDKYYHQLKSLECAKRGIRLIHIFEHEWLDNTKKEKLINLLYNCVVECDVRIGARNTIVKDINKHVAEEFCCKYHLQNYSNSSINIGCFLNEELVGVMTFGKPRFNNNYQYELIRLCWKDHVEVIGGTAKLFKYFITNYKASSVISYCDISKFTGNSYLKIGFTTDISKVTPPNYIWYHLDKKDILPRYKTKKTKLVNDNLGDMDETESEIMHKHDYVKIYDSGNITLEWRSK